MAYEYVVSSKVGFTLPDVGEFNYGDEITDPKVIATLEASDQVGKCVRRNAPAPDPAPQPKAQPAPVPAPPPETK